MDHAIENAAGVWEPLEFTMKDVIDVNKVQVEAFGYDDDGLEMTEENVEMFKEDYESGFICRKGGRAVAYALFSAAENPETLYVDEVAVIPSERTAGMTIKLVRLLRDYGNKHGFKTVSWSAVSDEMKGLTSRIAVEKDESDSHQDNVKMPIENLDISTLLNRQRKA